LHTNIAALVKNRDDAAAEIVLLDAKIEKLQSATQKASPAVVELAQLREGAAHAAANWNGEGELPRVDHKREARLQDEIAAFESSKRSAQSGAKALVDRRAEVQKAHARAENDANAAAIRVLFAEYEPKLVSEIIAARQTFFDLTEKRVAIRRWLLGQANVFGARDLSLAIEHSEAPFTACEPKVDLDDVNERLAELLTAKRNS
jgi:hypothetical protein